MHEVQGRPVPEQRRLGSVSALPPVRAHETHPRQLAQGPGRLRARGSRGRHRSQGRVDLPGRPPARACSPLRSTPERPSSGLPDHRAEAPGSRHRGDTPTRGRSATPRIHAVTSRSAKASDPLPPPVARQRRLSAALDMQSRHTTLSDTGPRVPMFVCRTRGRSSTMGRFLEAEKPGQTEFKSDSGYFSTPARPAGAYRGREREFCLLVRLPRKTCSKGFEGMLLPTSRSTASPGMMTTTTSPATTFVIRRSVVSAFCSRSSIGRSHSSNSSAPHSRPYGTCCRWKLQGSSFRSSG